LGLAALLRRIDTHGVNAAAEGVGHSIRSLSGILRKGVGGHTQHYGLFMMVGIVGFFLWAVLLR
jgi:hypothetical protein